MKLMFFFDFLDRELLDFYYLFGALNHFKEMRYFETIAEKEAVLPTSVLHAYIDISFFSIILESKNEYSITIKTAL